MNKLTTDMDIMDLDYEEMSIDENGNSIEENKENFAQLYASGQSITTKKKGADYYVKIANKLIDNMKRQIIAKANAMCEANGIEFDNSVFETMFNNAKLSAICKAVSGIDSKGASLNIGATATGLGIGTATAAGGGAIAGLSVASSMSAAASSAGLSIATSSSAAALTGAGISVEIRSIVNVVKIVV